MIRLQKPAYRTILATALMASALGACVVQTVVPPTEAPSVAHPAQEIAEFIALANRARLDAGCGELEWRDDVAAVAQAHSDDMRDRGYFDHVEPSGRTPLGRIRDAAIPISGVAENIGNGYPSGAAVLRGWLDSEGHRRNLLNCDYTHHGVGLAGAYWTHVLIRTP